MVVHINSTQAQQAFGKVIDQALAGNDVIIERYGSPRVAIINYRRYQQLLEAERRLLRQRLQSVSAVVSKQAVHLSDAEIDELIERSRQEVNQIESEK